MDKNKKAPRSVWGRVKNFQSDFSDASIKNDDKKLYYRKGYITAYFDQNLEKTIKEKRYQDAINIFKRKKDYTEKQRDNYTNYMFKQGKDSDQEKVDKYDRDIAYFNKEIDFYTQKELEKNKTANLEKRLEQLEKENQELKKYKK